MLYQWVLNRIRSIAAAIGAYTSICALCTILISVAIMIVISLIPLYLPDISDRAVGEIYYINNYSITVGFEIPQYNTTYNDTTGTKNYGFTSSRTPAPSFPFIACSSNNIGYCYVTVTHGATVTDTCYSQILSIIAPATPNAKVYNNYALGEACYRTLQTCSYDPLLSACLLSNCVAVGYASPSTNASYPLTYYTLICSASIYYKTRCLDSAASYRLNSSSSQQNSACRQQRLDRINNCLNSTVSILNVPCMISVSSGLVTSAVGTCFQVVNPYGGSVNVSDGFTWNTAGLGTSVGPGSYTLPVTFTYTAFSVTDQTIGHVYQIYTINSQKYSSNQSGAYYYGAITRADIDATVNTFLSNQTP